VAPSALSAHHIVKRFPGVLANDDVNFDVRAGEVHTLLGENGAGKSTLAAMLCGLYQPDSGHLMRNGKPLHLPSPRAGLQHGIAMVHQHFRLVDRFTVSENVILGSRDLDFRLDRKTINDRVAEVAESYGLPIDPSATVGDLSVGQRQRVEIVKALYQGAEILLLDEPTAVLVPDEVEKLFDNVHAMTKAGKSIVFISHKLGEVQWTRYRPRRGQGQSRHARTRATDGRSRHRTERTARHPSDRPRSAPDPQPVTHSQ